jgi:hypothetical protein
MGDFDAHGHCFGGGGGLTIQLDSSSRMPTTHDPLKWIDDALAIWFMG